MRFAAPLLAALLALSAGCAEDAPQPMAAEDPAAAEPLPPLPANFTEEVDVMAGADPFNFVPPTPIGGGAPCSMPQSSCSRFPFTLERPANVTATLDWGMESSDFDLYLMDDDGTDVAEGAGASNVGTIAAHEELSVSGLDEGDYEVLVSHWLVADETFTLVVEFT